MWFDRRGDSAQNDGRCFKQGIKALGDLFYKFQYIMIYQQKKRIEKKHIIYKAYIFLPINNDMFSNNIKCKFMSYLLVFMIIYLYIE